MPELSVTDEEAADLCAKLRALDLSEPQRALLDTIITIAWDATKSSESLDAEFAGSFEPGQAALIMAYHHATPASLISRSFGAGSDTMITRFISR